LQPIAGQRIMTREREKTPRDIVDELSSSATFREGAEGLAVQLGRDPSEVIDEARLYLAEMASVQNHIACDLWARLSRFLWRRAYRLDVEPDALERLRSLGADHSLVFLPSHKSYLDGFVIASLTGEHGLPHNHILAGSNMAFWPLGPLGRRAGVVWIRRSFGGNEVYKYAVRRYLAYLAAKRLNLEWYIEGRRSRTGKLLPPRMGLLNYLARGVEEAGVEEVMLVPVSIAYDQLHEVVEMTAQSRGAVKRPEGLGWMLRYVRRQRGDMGSVYVRFGEPVPLRATLASARVGHPERSLALSKVGFEVCTRINRATPLTPLSLVTLALLGTGERAVTVAQAQRAIQPLHDYVVRRELPRAGDIDRLADPDGIGAALDTLVAYGIAEVFADGSEPVYRVRPDRDLPAAFYRNVVIHWFVNRAILELGLVTAAEAASGADAVSAGIQEAMLIRDLLKFEFFFAEKRAFVEELRAELALIDPSWREKGIAGLQTLGEALAASGGHFADRVLRSFLEAYYIVADRLAAAGSQPIDEPALVKQCLSVGRQYQLQGRIVSAEAISSELFGTALKLAANRELLSPGEHVAERREAFRLQLADVLRRLEVLLSWDRARQPAQQPHSGRPSAGAGSPATSDNRVG
jgi:glycerol-3-phosphate O-acyltransferase